MVSVAGRTVLASPSWRRRSPVWSSHPGRSSTTLDAADVHLDGASATPLVLGEAEAPLERVAAVAGVLASAEAVGAAAEVLSLARGYASERRQFGRTIGSSRRSADCSPTCSSRSRARGRACSTPPRHSTRASRTISGRLHCKGLGLARDARRRTRGAPGLRWHRVHPPSIRARYLRRIASLGALFGTAADHERNLGRALAHSWRFPRERTDHGGALRLRATSRRARRSRVRRARHVSARRDSAVHFDGAVHDPRQGRRRPVRRRAYAGASPAWRARGRHRCRLHGVRGDLRIERGDGAHHRRCSDSVDDPLRLSGTRGVRRRRSRRHARHPDSAVGADGALRRRLGHVDRCAVHGRRDAGFDARSDLRDLS